MVPRGGNRSSSQINQLALPTLAARFVRFQRVTLQFPTRERQDSPSRRGFGRQEAGQQASREMLGSPAALPLRGEPWWQLTQKPELSAHVTIRRAYSKI